MFAYPRGQFAEGGERLVTQKIGNGVGVAFAYHLDPTRLFYLREGTVVWFPHRAWRRYRGAVRAPRVRYATVRNVGEGQNRVDILQFTRSQKIAFGDFLPEQHVHVVFTPRAPGRPADQTWLYQQLVEDGIVQIEPPHAAEMRDHDVFEMRLPI